MDTHVNEGLWPASPLGLPSLLLASWIFSGRSCKLLLLSSWATTTPIRGVDAIRARKQSLETMISTHAVVLPGCAKSCACLMFVKCQSPVVSRVRICQQRNLGGNRKISVSIQNKLPPRVSGAKQKRLTLNVNLVEKKVKDRISLEICERKEIVVTTSTT